jgi:hypothetical protein
MAADAKFEGVYFSILYSIKGNSIRYRARFHYLGVQLATLLNRSKKRKGEGKVIEKSRTVSIFYSIAKIWSLEYALSVM